MKKVIKGEIYNTETAEKIVQVDNRHHPEDSRYASETLYRSPKGQLFICKIGTFYKKHSNDQLISLVSEKEALEFCIYHRLTQEAQKHFPHLIEEG